MEPRLSVVIPTQDTRDLTLAALAALDGQTRAPNEVILVDDAGADGTREAVAAAFPRVRSLRLAPAVGYSRAVNAGAGATSGDLLWLLNSDTVAAPDAIQRLIAAFAADPSLGVAGAALTYPDGSPQWSGGAFPTPLWLFAMASGLPAFLGSVPMWRRLKPLSGTARLRAVDWVTGAAMAVRRQVWERVGPLCEDYAFYCQDMDLCWKASREGWNVRVLAEVRVVHAHGATMQLQHADPDPVNPELLWPDLVRYFALNHGRCSAELARSSLLLGGWLRLLGRSVMGPFQGRGRRAAWRAGTLRYRAALRALAH